MDTQLNLFINHGRPVPSGRRQIARMLPPKRQTLLFSATMPAVCAARVRSAVRLTTSIPSDLSSSALSCTRPDVAVTATRAP